MKNRFMEICLAVIPSALLTIFFEIMTEKSFIEKSGWFIVVFLGSFFLIEVVLFVWEGNLKAKFDLWKNGRIKGIWEKKGLIRQLEKEFDDSDEIRIKVTRGHALFEGDEEYGFIKFLDKLKNQNKEVVIRFLLIVPCFKLKHVEERFESKNGITPEEFLESWYESIYMMKKYSNGKLSLNVRFYLNEHSRWRFYIFSKGKGAKVDLFLTEYRDGPGIGEPMYKIIKKEPNIASFMTAYFDELWVNALKPLELYEKINNDECVRFFCGNCKQKDKCKDCPHGGCKYKETCKSYIEKYKAELNAFNIKKD